MNAKIIFIILLLVASIIIFSNSGKFGQESSRAESFQAESAIQALTLPSQVKTLGAVDVTVEPVIVTVGQELVLKLTLSTHSVELGYDLAQISTLTDTSGNISKPINWTGGSGGHHLSGELIFAPLREDPKELTLTISGIEGQTESFSWQL